MLVSNTDNSDYKVKPPLVSVIIPTHNRAGLLQQALASVFSQDGLGEVFELQVIVVDDASHDNTSEVVQKDRQIQYIRLDTNRGLSAARNVGIRASRGRYVAFLDDDDLWLPYKLAVQVPILEARPDVGVADSQIIIRFGERAWVSPDEQRVVSGWVFEAMLTKGDSGGVLGWLVRREAFEKAGYFDETLTTYEDYDMVLRLAFYFPFIFIQSPVAIYRLSIGGKYSKDILEERTEGDLRRVVNNALAMLPEGAENGNQVKLGALAHVELKIIQDLKWVGEHEQLQTQILSALRRNPWIAALPWVRSLITGYVYDLAIKSESPLCAVRAFSTEARAATRTRGLKGSLNLRMLLANIWMAIAISLAKGTAHQRKEAGYAAMRAIFCNPAKLRRTLLQILRRAVIAGFDSNAILGVLRRRIN